MDSEPRANNNGLAAVFYSLALGLLYPQSIVPLAGALCVFVGLRWWRVRKIVLRELNWVLVILLPVLPLAAYYGAIVIYNPTMTAWMSQNVTSAPPPWLLLVGFGLPLLISLPEIYRAIRHFEAHDDRFMLLWLLAMLVAMYLPSNIQRRFAVGMMLPLAYFATRAVEDFWFQWLSRRRWRYRVLVLLLPIVALTYVFVLLIPLLPVLTNRQANSQGLFLESDYVGAYDWLAQHTRGDEVILASEYVSLWLPGQVYARVVYGHPYETVDAANKKIQVDAWYKGEADCATLLDTYHVRYVIYGPEEAKLGDAPCLDGLKEVERAEP